MSLPPEKSVVFVAHCPYVNGAGRLDRTVVEACVVHLIGKKEFMWRGVRAGGLGRCRLRDEGLTWTRALAGEELDAFRVGVAL